VLSCRPDTPPTLRFGTTVQVVILFPVRITWKSFLRTCRSLIN